MATPLCAIAHQIRVFPIELNTPGNRGNPTTIFLNAGKFSSSQLQQLTQAYKHEYGFVMAGPELVDDADPPRYNVSIRFWVPGHEIETYFKRKTYSRTNNTVFNL